MCRHGQWPAWPFCPWDFPGKNTGMGCHTLLQGIFPTQELNPGVWHWRLILYSLSHQGSSGSINWFFSFLGSFLFLLLWMPGNFNRILLILYCWWQNFILSLNCIVVYSAAAAKLLQLYPTLCDRMDCSLPGFSVYGNSPGKNTGVSCHFLLQGIFPTQGSNRSLLSLLHLLHWQVHSFTTESPGKPLVNV